MHTHAETHIHSADVALSLSAAGWLPQHNHCILNKQGYDASVSHISECFISLQAVFNLGQKRTLQT